MELLSLAGRCRSRNDDNDDDGMTWVSVHSSSSNGDNSCRLWVVDMSLVC